MKKYIVLVILFVTASFAVPVIGQDGESDVYTYSFTYPRASIRMNRLWGNNDQEMIRLDSLLHAVSERSGEIAIGRVFITGHSSVEGDYTYNDLLARERAFALNRYLRLRNEALSHHPIEVAWISEDWKGLAYWVRHYQLNEQEEVQAIIRKVPHYNTRKRLIKKLNGGKSYQFIEEHILPKLRRVEVEVEVEMLHHPGLRPPLLEKEGSSVRDNDLQPECSASLPEQDDSQKENVSQVEHCGVSEPGCSASLPELPELPEGRGNRYHLAIKTNLLLLAGIQSDLGYTTPTANLALEYYINRHWSVELGGVYSYWHYNHDSEFQGLSGYWLEPRYSLPFAKDRLSWYIGAYGRLGDYDIMQDDMQYLGATGKYWDAGLSSGLLIALPYNWGIEIGARAGYVSSKVNKYEMDGACKLLKQRMMYHKIRITDINLTLIYRIK